MASIWADNIRIAVSGASHDEYIQAELSGVPAGCEISENELVRFMKRRAPGQSEYVSKRKEEDVPVVLSGITNGVTDGNKLVIRIYNKDVKSESYEKIQYFPRPGHADYTAFMKSNGTEDMRGGGRFSGRMTAAICAIGGIAKQILFQNGIDVFAHLYSVGNVQDIPFDLAAVGTEEKSYLNNTAFPVLSSEKGEEMLSLIKTTSEKGDSVGGVIECAVTGVPAGLGDALFDGLESKISSLVYAIPAVKGIEFGAGFSAATLTGSQNNDSFVTENGNVYTETNNAGGILGGITSGMPIVFRTAFKPTPSISLPQRTVNLKTLEKTEIQVEGRHDPCVAIRAVPVIEAAAALAVLNELQKPCTSLNSLRGQIDIADEKIEQAFIDRIRIADKIGEYKRINNLPVYDESREQEVIAKRLSSCDDDCLNEVEQLFSAVISICRNRQNKDRNNSNG